MHDYIVIGAGPAGLQLGYFFGKAGRDYLILERGQRVANFFRHYPRSRQFISFSRPPMPTNDPKIQRRFDWNSLLADDGPVLRDFDKSLLPKADNMVAYLEAFAGHHNIRVQFNRRVVSVTKEGEVFTLTDEDGQTYATPCLIMASGIRRHWGRSMAVKGRSFGCHIIAR